MWRYHEFANEPKFIDIKSKYLRIFLSNLRKSSEKVLKRWYNLRAKFEKSSEIFRKSSEIFSNSSKTALLVCLYCIPKTHDRLWQETKMSAMIQKGRKKCLGARLLYHCIKCGCLDYSNANAVRNDICQEFAHCYNQTIVLLIYRKSIQMHESVVKLDLRARDLSNIGRTTQLTEKISEHPTGRFGGISMQVRKAYIITSDIRTNG